MTSEIETSTDAATADLGDLMIVLLCSTLSGLRDRLAEAGSLRAADLVADLVDIADDYIRDLVRNRAPVDRC